MQTYFIELSYLLASIFFILGLKGLSHPETAKRGMHLAEFGMLMAIIGTLLHHEIVTYIWIIAGLAIGSVVGLAMGLWVPMTAMPQRTALSHAFGAFAAALVGISEFCPAELFSQPRASFANRAFFGADFSDQIAQLLLVGMNLIAQIAKKFPKSIVRMTRDQIVD